MVEKSTLQLFCLMSLPKPKTFTLFLIDNWSIKQIPSVSFALLTARPIIHSSAKKSLPPQTGSTLSWHCHHTEAVLITCTICLCSFFWSLLRSFSSRKLCAERIWRAASLRSRGASTSPVPSSELSTAALKWVRDYRHNGWYSTKIKLYPLWGK